MDPKSLILLEYHKVLARLKSFTCFEASMKLAEALRPTANLEKALHLQAETSEARLLLSLNADLDFEGASDMRLLTDQAQHGITLEAAAFLAIRNTLTLSREAKRILEELADKVPLLADLGADLSGGLGLVDQINRTITERGEVLDTASEDLNRIRSR